MNVRLYTSVISLAVLALSGNLEAQETSLAGRYTTTDFRDRGFMQFKEIQKEVWSLSISSNGELPDLIAGGVGQPSVVTATEETLRQRMSTDNNFNVVRCLAYGAPINVLIFCSAPPGTRLQFRGSSGSLVTHTTNTGYVALLDLENGGTPRDLRRL
jgi:hypothetical protein